MLGIIGHIEAAACLLMLGFLIGVIWHQGIAVRREDELYAHIDRLYARLRELGAQGDEQ